MRLPRTLSLNALCCALTLVLGFPHLNASTNNHTAPAPVAQTPTPQQVWQAYTVRLAALCGSKHLEMLPQSDLTDLAESFTESLPADDQRAIQSSIGRSCRNIAGGASCDTVGFLQAVVPLRLIGAFATRVCALPQRCNSPSNCAVIKH